MLYPPKVGVPQQGSLVDAHNDLDHIHIPVFPGDYFFNIPLACRE